MGKSDFSRVSGSAKRLLYGQRGALVCGYTVLDQDALLVMMERWNFGDVPVVFYQRHPHVVDASMQDQCQARHRRCCP